LAAVAGGICVGKGGDPAVVGGSLDAGGTGDAVEGAAPIGGRFDDA
jgi:hypothetical protein